jgi:hypothetical protein
MDEWMKGEHLWMNFVHDYVNDNVGSNVGDDANNDVGHDGGNDVKCYNVSLDVGYVIHNISSPFNNEFHNEWLGFTWVSTMIFFIFSMTFVKCIINSNMCSLTL